MVEYLPRSAWGARAPNGGPGNLTASRVQGAVIHWPGTGSSNPIHSRSAVASALRGWQAYHMDSRGWSDIAYQIAVDQAGRAWTLRGLRTQSGANGNADLNERYGAILLVLVSGEQPSAAMKATTRGVIADFRRIFPRGTAIRPHSAVRPDGTDCPGPAARAAIARGDFNPTTSSPEDELTPAQMRELKNFIEARTQAYAVWVFNRLKRDLGEVVQAYTMDLKKYDQQTNAADAARAAAAVWATAPEHLKNPPTGAGEPSEIPDDLPPRPADLDEPDEPDDLPAPPEDLGDPDEAPESETPASDEPGTEKPGTEAPAGSGEADSKSPS